MDNNWMNRARARMRDKKISQDQLAQSLECTRGAISHYLAGRRIPNLHQLESIAAYLGVHPSWLLYGIETGEVHELAASYKTGIPLIGTSASGPTDSKSGSLLLPALSPPCYALQVTGTAYAPRMYEGESLLLDPGMEVQPGDDIVIRFKNEPGAGLYTFIHSRDHRVFVSELMDSTQRHVFERDRLEFMHCIVAVVNANSVQLD